MAMQSRIGYNDIGIIIIENWQNTRKHILPVRVTAFDRIPILYFTCDDALKIHVPLATFLSDYKETINTNENYTNFFSEWKKNVYAAKFIQKRVWTCHNMFPLWYV